MENVIDIDRWICFDLPLSLSSDPVYEVSPSKNNLNPYKKFKKKISEGFKLRNLEREIAKTNNNDLSKAFINNNSQLAAGSPSCWSRWIISDHFSQFPSNL